MYTGITGRTHTFFGRPYRAPPLNTPITFNNEITTTPKHCEFFHHVTHKTKDPLTGKHRKYNDTTLHLPQLRSKRQSKKVLKKYSQGLDKLNIRHLKHIGSIRLTVLTGEEHSSLHNSKHTKHTHATRVQNTTLYIEGTTHSKQHHSKGVQTSKKTKKLMSLFIILKQLKNEEKKRKRMRI